MVFALVLIVYVFVCVILCLLVLIQSDKGGGISGAIGGGLSGANTLLGTQDTANILTRGTTIFASAFMLLCIVLSLFLSNTTVDAGSSALKERAEQQENFSPASILDEEPLPVAPEEEAEMEALPQEETPEPDARQE
jgi:preprotein translocase subunit SecG